MRVVIDREGDGYVADRPGAPGFPPVGRGKTMTEALGDFVRHHQSELGLEIEVAPGAQDAERERWERGMAER